MTLQPSGCGRVHASTDTVGPPRLTQVWFCSFGASSALDPHRSQMRTTRITPAPSYSSPSCTSPSTSTVYAPSQAAQSPSHTPCIPKQTSLCFGPGGEDSNPRPPTWNDGALPSELHPDWRARLDSNQQLQVPLQPCADLPHYRYATTPPMRHDRPCSPHASYGSHHTAVPSNTQAYA